MQKTAGFLIGLFYLIIVVFGVLLLAMGQFRSTGGSAFDTWRLNYKSNRILKTSHQDKLDKLRKAASDNRDLLNYTDQCFSLYDASGRLNPNIDAATLEEVRSAKSGVKKPEDLPFGEASCIFRGPTLLRYDKTFYTNTDEDTKQEIFSIQKLLVSDEEQYSDLIKGHQEFLALIEMENAWYTKLLVDIPYDLLVLFLVMSMGMLGGIIRVLRDYGAPDRSNPSLKDYIFIPFIGAVVAIGGYILAKTGLLLLSSTKGETSLSPFMIGLVGMVSGLLAKEVVDRIAAYGHEVLKDQTGAKTLT